MSGYWNDPVRNEQVLVRRPAAGGLDEIYFKTGDRARVLPGGDLAFVARADRQVKVRGHRVELEEVEGALLSLTTVEEAAVFTVEDGEGSSALRAAVVVGGGGSPPAERDILGELRSLLPPYALPAEVRIVDAMPRTPTGKVDLRALAGAAGAPVGSDGD
jgi:acyl-coenzyme A synthetase/AMP-(fatty) acid ligase